MASKSFGFRVTEAWGEAHNTVARTLTTTIMTPRTVIISVVFIISYGIAKGQEKVFRDLNVAVDVVVGKPRRGVAVQAGTLEGLGFKIWGLGF